MPSSGFRWSTVVTLGLVTAWSCTEPAEEGAEAGESPDAERPAPVSPPFERATTRLDTISIEGMPEVHQLRLIRQPQDFGIPFSTYVPEGFEVETVENDSGQAVRFLAAFGGTYNPAAFLEVALYPDAISQEEAMRRAGSELPDAARVPDNEAAPWPLAEWRARGTDPSGRFTGVARLTSHDGRFVRVLMRYPLEYGDGFPARSAVILEEWRWNDGRPFTERIPR